MENLISVIIPIYNTQEYLPQCLDSVINQTYENLEIILVDDGSTDGSGEICDEYAKRDARVVVIHRENGGESCARNAGLDVAKGEYIAFCDCDDWLETNMYSVLIHEAVSNNLDIIASSWISEAEHKTEKIINLAEASSDVILRDELLEYIYKRDKYRGFAYMWNKLYRRELFNDNGEILRFDENLMLGGDVLMLGQLCLNSKRAKYIDTAFYHYRQRLNSGCKTEDIQRRKHWLQAYLILLEKQKEANISRNITVWVERFLVYHTLLLTEICIAKHDTDGILYCLDIITLYESAYKATNKAYPNRHAWFNNIIRSAKLEVEKQRA